MRKGGEMLADFNRMGFALPVSSVLSGFVLFELMGDFLAKEPLAKSRSLDPLLNAERPPRTKIGTSANIS